MIDYQTYCQIRRLFTEKQLGLRQIARALKLGLNTVRKWVQRDSFKRAPMPKRCSKLDPFKGEIIRLLEQHDYSAQQIFQQLQQRGYQGRYSILGAFVRQVGVDNCKVAVLSRGAGSMVFNPRYLDFANH